MFALGSHYPSGSWAQLGLLGRGHVPLTMPTEYNELANRINLYLLYPLIRDFEGRPVNSAFLYLINMMYMASEIPWRIYRQQYRVQNDTVVILSRLRDIAWLEVAGYRDQAGLNSHGPPCLSYWVGEAPMETRVPMWGDLVPNNNNTADVGRRPVRMRSLEVEAPLTTETSGANVLNAHAFMTQGERPELTRVQDNLVTFRPEIYVLNILNALAFRTDGAGRGRPECARIQDIQDARAASWFCPERTCAHDVQDAKTCPEYHECKRFQYGVPRGGGRPECARMQERAFKIFGTPAPRPYFSLNARAFRTFRATKRLLYIPNARAFRTKSGHGVGVLNIRHPRAFRTPPIRPECTCIQDAQSGRWTSNQDVQDSLADVAPWLGIMKVSWRPSWMRHGDRAIPGLGNPGSRYR